MPPAESGRDFGSGLVASEVPFAPAISSNVVGGLDRPLRWTGVVGRAEGVELLDPKGSDLKGTGIDMRAWFLSPAPLLDADLVIDGMACCEFRRAAGFASSEAQPEFPFSPDLAGAWPGESMFVLPS